MKYSALGTLSALISVSLLAACGDDSSTNSPVGAHSTATTAKEDAGTKPVKTATASATETSSAQASATLSASASATTTSTAVNGDASVSENDSGVAPVPTETASATGTEEPPAPPTECPSIDELRKDAANIETVTAIDEDTLWTCEKIYLLAENTAVVVKNDSTLSIGPGTHVFGRAGSSLIVTAGSRLVAEGEKENPVVFTSAKVAGTRAPADWGGVLIMGKAPINEAGGTAKGEGIDPTLPYASYGGSDTTHDCGSLKYVRIEFGGFTWAPMKELNNLGLAGCGSKTKLDYVQLHKGSDDGIEFWGGSPQVSHIVSSFNQDDSFDWTGGFASKVQFLAIVQDASGDNGIEADNSETDWAAEPRTQPELYNVTMFGGGKLGMVLRRGTWGKIYNAIIRDFAPGSIDIRTKISADAATAGKLSVENSIFFHNGATNFPDDSAADSVADTANEASDEGLNEATFFAQADKHNQIGVDPGVGNASGDITFVPETSSPAAQGAAKPPAGYDRDAEYIGAFEPGGEDWTADWTNWEAN